MQKDAPLSIESREGKTPGTRILALNGPLTLPNVFQFQSTVRGGELPHALILDFSGVPFIDSAGMGAIINAFVYFQGRKVKLIAAGVGDRVLELFKLTQVDSVIPLKASVDEAEAGL